MSRRIFIGSSTEALSWADAICSALTHDAQPTTWPHIFDPSAYPLESLIETFDQSDYGLFVFCPDDVTLMRGIANMTVRDNVILEFGISIGKLGRRKTFFLLPQDVEMHLPSDLTGLTRLYYDPTKHNYNEAVYASSRRILETMAKFDGSTIQELSGVAKTSPEPKFSGTDAKHLLEDHLMDVIPFGGPTTINLSEIDRNLNFAVGETKKLVEGATASLGFTIVSVGDLTAQIQRPAPRLPRR